MESESSASRRHPGVLSTSEGTVYGKDMAMSTSSSPSASASSSTASNSLSDSSDAGSSTEASPSAGSNKQASQDEQELADLIAKFRACAVVGDRKRLLRHYPASFVGSDTIKAMVSSGLVKSEKEAIELGGKLFDLGLFHNVKNKPGGLINTNRLYRFSGDTGHLLEIGPGFWNVRASQPVKKAGITIVDIQNHMSLVHRSSGKFLLLDTVNLAKGEIKKELDELTNGGKGIEAVLCLHPFHTLWIPAFHKQYPHSKLYGCPRHLKKLPSIPWAGNLGEAKTLSLFEPDLFLRIPPGIEFADPKPSASNHFSSVVAFHPRSKTIHVDDTFTYHSNPGAILRRRGVKPNTMRFHMSMDKSLLPDPAAPRLFQRWVRALLEEWDFDSICFAHCGNRVGGAKAMLKGLLESNEERFKRLTAAREGKGVISSTSDELPSEAAEELEDPCLNSSGEECG
eukprot:gb/GEZN01006819.1/.p1 GENE.gb/GEZN01006819.1/~~gb/GEZN01006819.1/.p1  ORF type:complete len:454 (-),score=48.90 gb/GEZN01006819.1/:202-1563(-)